MKKENVIDQILENISTEVIQETDSNDIASTQDILTSLVKEKYNTSLLWQVCDVMPIKGTLGRVYVAKKKYNGIGQPIKTDFEVVKKDIIPKTYTLQTGFTKEVLQDMKFMFKKDAKDVIGGVLRGVSDWNENQHLMEFIEANATAKPDLVLSPDPKDDIEYITKRVGEAVLEMNKYSYKTQKSWCILPFEYSSLFFGYWSGFRMGDVDDHKYLFIGTFGRTDYYIDPREPKTIRGEFDDSFDDSYALGDLEHDSIIYVGLKSKDAPGYGSIIFAPYTYELKYVTDPETGNSNVFLFNRYGLEMSPFHNPMEHRNMIHKFKVTRAP
jgi:hypothetical protein